MDGYFSPDFDNIFTANKYIRNAEEEGGLSPPGALLPSELVPQYRCMNFSL